MEIVELHSQRIALVDGYSDKVYCFADLQKILDKRSKNSEIVYCKDVALGFILDLLQSWRDKIIFVPFEKDSNYTIDIKDLYFDTCLVKIISAYDGKRKAVQFSESQVFADAFQINQGIGYSKNMINIGVLNMAHSYGFTNQALMLLLHGLPLHILPNALPLTLRNALKNYEQITISAVPLMWRAWYQSDILKKLNQKNILAISAGSPLSLDLEKNIFYDTGVKIHNLYGCSECGGGAYDSSDSPRENSDLIGELLPGVKVTISSEGFIKIKSEAVGLGYGKSEKVDCLNNGVFRSYDVGKIVQNQLSILEYKGKAINVAGRKISPHNIEKVLQKIKGVKACKVTGEKSRDSERVEEITVYLDIDLSYSLLEIKKQAVKQLASWEVPRIWKTSL